MGTTAEDRWMGMVPAHPEARGGDREAVEGAASARTAARGVSRRDRSPDAREDVARLEREGRRAARRLRPSHRPRCHRALGSGDLHAAGRRRSRRSQEQRRRHARLSRALVVGDRRHRPQRCAQRRRTTARRFRGEWPARRRTSRRRRTISGLESTSRIFAMDDSLFGSAFGNPASSGIAPETRRLCGAGSHRVCSCTNAMESATTVPSAGGKSFLRKSLCFLQVRRNAMKSVPAPLPALSHSWWHLPPTAADPHGRWKTVAPASSGHILTPIQTTERPGAGADEVR